MGTLEYETRFVAPRRPEHYREAVRFAACPMVAGTLIFLFWLTFRWDWLMMAGWVTILVGLMCVAAGFINLCAYGWTELRAGTPTLGKLVFRLAVATALLLLNFPLAWLYASIATGIQSRYWVTFVNGTATTIESIEVSDGAFRQQFGPLQPGATVRNYIRSKIKEGPVTFVSTDSRGTTMTGTIDGYVTTVQPGDATVSFGSEGTRVTRNQRR